VERIGDRDKPLKSRTIERIEYGLKKYARCVTVPLSHMHAGAKRGWPVDDPLPTQTTQQTLGLAVPPFLMHYYTRTSAHSPVDEPVPTCTGDPRFALICPPFLAVNYGGNHAKSIEETFGTITTVDHHSLIVPPFMVEFYGQSKTSEITEPLSTMLSEVHQGVVIPFLASYYGSNNARPVTDAMGTVTSLDHHALVEPTDSLKVEDCGFRMIQPHEIQAAMAFPETYQVLGNKRDKVRQLGNAVTPPVMRMLVERCVASLT
jgi:DNA (cytosine-5)-methyltransferase 1